MRAKSTLLKVLSAITDPPAARRGSSGALAPLIEVGTAFHPELAGREKHPLNGAILGMSKEEVRDRFDAIVEFADIERFLDMSGHALQQWYVCAARVGAPTLR